MYGSTHGHTADGAEATGATEINQKVSTGQRCSVVGLTELTLIWSDLIKLPERVFERFDGWQSNGGPRRRRRR
jgi:hypothetical protein